MEFSLPHICSYNRGEAVDGGGGGGGGGHLTLDHSTGLSPPSLQWLLLCLVNVLPLLGNLPTVGTLELEIPPGEDNTRNFIF